MGVEYMRRRFFFQNLRLFLIILFIPAVILGSISIGIVENYIRKNSTADNNILLGQIKENVELIIGELEPLKLSYGIDGQTTYYSKKLLESKTLDYSEINSLKIIINNLSSLSNAREYIHSIYLYFENNHNNFITNSGKEEIGIFTDTEWFQSYLNNKDNKKEWSERRIIPSPVGKQEIVSIYNLLDTKNSVIVFNLRPQYIDRIIQNRLKSNGQNLIIINEKNEILFGDNNFLSSEELSFLIYKIKKEGKNSFEMTVSDTKYIINADTSGKNGWVFVLFSSKFQVFRLYYYLLSLIVFALIFLIAVGVIVSVYFTRKNTNQVYKIIDIIQAAENNSTLPEIEPKNGTTYDFIIQNILKSFINQSYLKMQLETRKYKLKTAQLTALQAQINPHFLFNTLETINWMVYQMNNKASIVNDMIENLSSLLRYSLASTEQPVTLQDEIDSIKNYIYIQKIRYDNKFDIIWEYDDNILNVKLPRLILQPLLENAISHGLKPKGGAGLIKIKIRKKQNELVISIIDNGAGMTKDKLQKLLKSLEDDDFQEDHIGIKNVNTRLKLYYNRQLKIWSKEGLGTIVNMYIPERSAEIVQDTDC